MNATPSTVPTAPANPGHRRNHVVVVGAGFGGVAAARSLADVPVDVTVVDARNHHTFQPLLYQVATAGLDGDDVTYPTRGIFHRQNNATVRMAKVIGGDLDERRLDLADGDQLHYDHLVLAAGAVTNTFGVPGVEEHAHGLKSLRDALAIRAQVLRAFEEADARPELIDQGLLTVVIAGGGPTGVELAGGMVELFEHVLAHDFPRLDIRRARVILVEMTDRLLGPFHPRLGAKAKDTLSARRVEVMLSTTVDEVRPASVVLSGPTVGERVEVPAHTMIWAAGVRANPLGTALGLDTGPGGRIRVNDDLSLADHPEVFAIGDFAAANDPGGSALPQLAPVAMQAGEHAADMIRSRLEGHGTEAFSYTDKGTMATVGRASVVAQLPGGLRFSGLIGWLAWLALHLVQLVGFRNRLNVLVNWAWNYLTYDRASRIIPEEDADA
ncbi:MAG: NAD(P)/FAD-dependent oxidoreductase [Microthrixaceae bacterium]